MQDHVTVEEIRKELISLAKSEMHVKVLYDYLNEDSTLGRLIKPHL